MVKILVYKEVNEFLPTGFHVQLICNQHKGGKFCMDRDELKGALNFSVQNST